MGHSLNSYRRVMSTALWAILGVSGCREEVNAPVEAEIAVRIASDRTGYGPGNTAAFTVTNEDREAFTYGGLCGSVLERNLGSSWAVVVLSSSPCPALGRVIAPGEAHEYQFSLPGELTSGEFRLRVDFQRFSGNGSIVHLYKRSNSFQVSQ